MTPHYIRRVCAFLGAAGIAAAAFGAHGLEKIATEEQVRWWAIATCIHLVTAPVALSTALHPEKCARFSPLALLAGIFVFCGSLYGMALGGPRILGAVTPVGGLLLMIGWGALAFSPKNAPPESHHFSDNG